MSDKFGINVSSGISGASPGGSARGMSGEMVDGLKSKTLIENPGDKGVLGDGVRVSEESKFLVRESNIGVVISETELKSAESGNLETNDKHDASKNRVAEMVSHNNRWESWGVMNMVGRVLDGKFYMDNEVEDVDDSENQGGPNLVPEMNACQDVTGEPASEKKIDIKRTDNDNDSVKLDSGHPGEGSGLNGNQDLVSHEMVPDGQPDSEEELINDTGLLIPKARGEDDITEKEGKYYVSDMVWGKVKWHPWWPGQIFAPMAGSDKAAMHVKRRSYLIAYFGDQTFAWNEGSAIKPFRMHFSEMEKQSNADSFSHAVQCALDESARRVEFGLSCPCLPQEVHNEIKFQIVENAGLLDQPHIREGGDNLSTAASFLPGDVMQLLESLAVCPQSKPDRLQFSIAKAQLIAYNRWKGHCQLPVFEHRGGLLEDDAQLNVTGAMQGVIPGPVSEVANDFSSRKRKSTARDGSSSKRKHLSGNEERPPQIKENFISVLLSSGSSSSQNNDEKAARRSTSYSKGRRRKNLLAISLSSESQTVEMTPAEIPGPETVLSKLILAARKPMQGHDAVISVVGLLREFRNSICLEKSSPLDMKLDFGKRNREQPSDFQTADTFGLEGAKDSYWTDRIIQSYSQDQAVVEPQKPKESGAQPEGNIAGVSSLDDNKERKVIVISDEEDAPAVVNEVSDYCPTALILTFKTLESIPPIRNLNQIFRPYGPLDESDTKILEKSKRAKVIFKRKEDAETAFSSTGKYKIFGEALLSYRLHYEPIRRKARAASKKGRKDKKDKASKADAV